jgi:tetratricopeptide (TPR) repeat protein
MRGAPLLLALALAGCFGVGADHERLGDEALAKGDAVTALAEYQAALGVRGSAQLYAKLGAAALRTGNRVQAAEAFRDLVADDPSRLDEAVTGLEITAEASEHANDAAGLAAAVSALRDLAPDRLAARHALALVRSGSLAAPELVAVLPFALAAAPDAGVMDSLLVVYGSALRETTACEEAVRAFEALRRRTRDRRLLDRAKEGLAACGLELGLEALTARDRFSAERWFAIAVGADSTSGAGRRALLELGDIRRTQGDFLGAAMAYQSVATATANDSLGRAAREKLDVIGAAVPDTTQ